MTENTVKNSTKAEVLNELEKVKMPTRTMKKLYAIKDVKAGFKTIFQAENDLLALRMLYEDANNKESPVCKYAEDIELYAVGAMCYENGELESNVKFLARAIDYKKTQSTGE